MTSSKQRLSFANLTFPFCAEKFFRSKSKTVLGFISVSQI
nr:MAG TPA: hypothetical protein [Caudoviricetes sp.]